jgi:hypothetical protein
MLISTRLFGDGKHGHAERIQTFRGPACHTTFTARRHTPLYRLKTPSYHISMVRISRSQKGWMLPPPNGSSATVRPPSLTGCLALASTLSPCTSAASAISRSLTSSWTNCAPGYAAPHRCSGCGWQSIPSRRFFPCLGSAPERKTWRICSSTPSDRFWPPFCLPLFTSHGLNVYFYALTAHFGQWLALGRRGRNVLQWQVEAGLIYGQVKKSYRRRKLVRVSQVMRLGTEAALKVALQGLGLTGRLNTAIIPRVNLTIRHGIAALARRTWATAQQSPHLLAHLEWWRAYYHFVRPHASLRVVLVQPRERGGKLLAQRYRQCTEALAAGRTSRRRTVQEVLCYPLPPVPCGKI